MFGYTEDATPDNIPMKIFEAIISYKDTGRVIEGNALREPADAYAYLKDIIEINPMQETFWVVFLNTRRRVIGRICVTTGTATASLAHPREVFRGAILANASCIMIAHTHPSGDPEPSSADISLTRQVRDAGRVVGIEVIDHIIIGSPDADPAGRGFYSFRLSGLI
jgi:DNA repair protein RadC